MADEKRIYELDPIADNAVSDSYVVPIDDDDFLETQKVTVAGINLIEKTRAEGVENAIIAGAGLESDGSYEADNSTYYITAQNFVDAGLSETQSNALILLDAAIKAVDDKTACYQKTFTSAEILGLDSTPIEFMPAPSPSFMYDLVHIYGWITFNTTAYDGSSPLRLRFVGEGTELANIPLTFLEAAGTTYFKGTVNNDVELVSAAIELYSDDAIIDGDSEITLVGCYALIPNTLYPSVCDPMCVPEVPFGVDSGKINAAVVVTGTPYAPAQGAEVVVELGFTETSGTPTCNINGSGDIIMCNNNETGTAITAGQLVKGGRYTLSYDSALAKYKVKNPTLHQHALDSTDDHTIGSLSNGYLIKSTGSKLANATNTDAEVSDAVSKKHTQAHDVDSSSDHNAAAAGNYGKYLKANSSTGAIEWAAPSTIIPHAADGGSSTAYTGTYTPAIVLTDGQIVSLDAANTNTTATPTLNLNGTGAKTIICQNGLVVPYGGIVAGGRYLFQYDSGAGKFILLNPTFGSNDGEWKKLTVVYTDTSTAATTKTILVRAMSAREYVVDTMVYLKTNMRGGAISALTVTLQGDSSTMGTAMTVYTGAAANHWRHFELGNNIAQTSTSGYNLNLLFSSTGANLDAQTQGEIEFYYRIGYLPSI